MDIFLAIGVITGILAVVVGMIIKGAGVTALLNPAAAVIIFVGTFAAVMNSYPKDEFLKIPKILGVLISDKEGLNPFDIINKISEMALTARKEGLLVLEDIVEDMDNKFLKKGIGMVIDGNDQDYIREVMEFEIDSMEERHRLGSSIFSTAGTSAPTLGVLGAVIGLIGALGNINDTEKLGHMIAAAFVATLYGIFLGYVICHPFATRLKRKSSKEIKLMEIMLEGILAIQVGENPKTLEAKLVGMLDPGDRLEYERIKNEGRELNLKEKSNNYA